MNNVILAMGTQEGTLHTFACDATELVSDHDDTIVTRLMLWQVYDPIDELTLPHADPECVDIEPDVGNPIYHATVDVLLCYTENGYTRYAMGYYSYRAKAWHYSAIVGVHVPNVTHWAYIAPPVGGIHVQLTTH